MNKEQIDRRDRREVQPRATRALAVGAAALGAFALGSAAVGAVAIGRLAIGAFAMKRGGCARWPSITSRCGACTLAS
jgi:hypothetical protein